MNFTAIFSNCIMYSRDKVEKVCKLVSLIGEISVHTFGYAFIPEEFPVRGACATERSRSGRIVAQKYMLYSPSCFGDTANSA